MAVVVGYRELVRPTENRVAVVDTDDYKEALEMVEFHAGGKNNLIRAFALVPKLNENQNV